MENKINAIAIENKTLLDSMFKLTIQKGGYRGDNN